jgi:hypothetical protein
MSVWISFGESAEPTYGLERGAGGIGIAGAIAGAGLESTAVAVPPLVGPPVKVGAGGRGVAVVAGGAADARGVIDGFPCQLLRTSTLAGEGRGVAPAAGAAPSAGSPGKPVPRGAGSEPPSIAAARAWSRFSVSGQSRFRNATRLMLIRWRAVMLSELMFPA